MEELLIFFSGRFCFSEKCSSLAYACCVGKLAKRINETRNDGLAKTVKEMRFFVTFD